MECFPGKLPSPYAVADSSWQPSKPLFPLSANSGVLYLLRPSSTTLLIFPIRLSIPTYEGYCASNETDWLNFLTRRDSSLLANDFVWPTIRW